MEAANRELLVTELTKLGLSSGATEIDAVIRHLELVAEWNERVNLTAVTAERDMVIKHAVDSAMATSLVSFTPNMRVIDIGTGAGFPGVTLKCLVPGLKVTLLESLQKRCKFLEVCGSEVVSRVAPGPSGYWVVWGRAEEKGQAKEYREQFDVAVARAVAELRVLAEYCLPFVKVGGVFLAMKGPAAGEEIAGARRAIEILGGEIENFQEVELPEGAGQRTLIAIRKARSTPKTYPRKAGTPSKNPL